MVMIANVGIAEAPYSYTQEQVKQAIAPIFEEAVGTKKAERLLRVFDDNGMETRQFVEPLENIQQNRSFATKNAIYHDAAFTLAKNAIEATVPTALMGEIDAIICVTSTGIQTPSLDVRLINELPLHFQIQRMPLWGLGCAGGAIGMSRAYDYCKAHPHAKVLLVTVECCSTTYTPQDLTKSNLIGTCLFGDGAACAVLGGDLADWSKWELPTSTPTILKTASFLLPESEDVMGWGVEEDGLRVIFSKDIPGIVQSFMPGVLHAFGYSFDHLVAHPGGRKVLDAFEEALQVTPEQTKPAREVLKRHGNMSSPTVLFVLKELLESKGSGLMVAMGPGFCAEILALEWRETVR
ncbi:type III polyketide synthase [Paenalkalicoccus suaedae]|uniref:Type III polyketide synthase n=1 Tax=Paenalkalicoccus suaedae TaxID=2592382 RepID=A0A859FDV6_9BACI|nr:type III polyketide synthase [Paenalkalicoccus suaedae]QKS70406.1 type III polyketide synthase [Paenalkalicoccus suaedae]